MSDQQCLIKPNPDIAGVGVRASIYAQAILSAVLPIISSYDGILDATEIQSLHTMYTGILLTGCALLLSAVIQEATHGLSVYHALIVLNLSWINNMGAITFFVLMICRYLLNEYDTRSSRFTNLTRQLRIIGRAFNPPELFSNLVASAEPEPIRPLVFFFLSFFRALFLSTLKTAYISMIGSFWPVTLAPKAMKGALSPFKARVIAVLIMCHTTFIGGFGYWLWLLISGSEDQANCLSLIRLVVLPSVARPVIQPSIRLLFRSLHLMAVYLPIQALFFVIILLPTFIVLIAMVSILDGIRKLDAKEAWARRFYLSGAFSCLLFQIFTIVSTELTIIANQSLVDNGGDSNESDWTFGQTLAVIMVVVPLVEVGKFFWKKVPWARRAEGSREVQQFLGTRVSGSGSGALVWQYGAEGRLEYYIIDSGSLPGSATYAGSTEVNALLELCRNGGDLRSNNMPRRSGDSERGLDMTPVGPSHAFP